MNPTLIYSNYRDDALASQVKAKEYNTFVAMPFQNWFSYREKEVFENVIVKAVDRANERNEESKKRFATPLRVKDTSQTSIVITEKIVFDILHAHIFIGDLTFTNPGVLLETGIALGLKPNEQIILITQGKPEELHFDLKVTNVIGYNSDDAIEKIASAFIKAAESFEKDAGLRVNSITETLSLDALAALNNFGKLRKNNPRMFLFGEVRDNEYFPDSTTGELRYVAALRELNSKRLFKTYYKTKVTATSDEGGTEATDLGWEVIGRLWPELKRNLLASTFISNSESVAQSAVTGVCVDDNAISNALKKVYSSSGKPRFMKKK
jgi:hypothetical protein